MQQLPLLLRPVPHTDAYTHNTGAQHKLTAQTFKIEKK